MTNKRQIIQSLILLFIMIVNTGIYAQAVTIGLIGDSTVASTYGWGPAFAEQWNNQITVLNYAKNGATLQSLAGKLDEILEHKPDYVLIQFGHNDQKIYGSEEYSTRLKDYVDRIKKAGGRAIVLSSVTRRNFDENGRIKPRTELSVGVPLKADLGTFEKAVQAVAQDEKIPFINLYSISVEHHNRIGPEESATYNFNANDTTHFNPKGARAIAGLIITELKIVVPELQTYLLTVSGHKVILPDFHADPSARVFGDKLYIYPSHDPNGAHSFNEMADWHVFSTDDMLTWTDHGVIFSLKDIAWADEQAWAPDCIERNGKYYFYFTADSQIGVAVSDSPTGPFKDAVGKPLIKSNEADILWMIDPCVFIDDDGQAYLYVGGANKLAVVKLKEDMITRDGPVQLLDMEGYYDGIWVHKRNGIYYASYPTRSSGQQTNKMVYSMAGNPLGPFEFKGEIIDNHSPNVHGSITKFKDKWYLFYHVAGPGNWERHVCAAPLSYNDDDTILPIEITPSK